MKFMDILPNTPTRVTMKMCGCHIDPTRTVPDAPGVRTGKSV